ncbi:MAG: Vgb family protein [Nitrosotalea sp.]
MLFRKIIVIVILIILIAAVIILFNNFETQTTTGNKTTVDAKSNNGLDTIQNNSISKNIPDFIFKSKYVTTYSLPNDTGPNGILVDSNGLVWTSGSFSHVLFRLDPNDGNLTGYAIPIEKHGSTMVWSMVEDKDRNIWFSQFGLKPLWRFDPHTKKFEAFHTSYPPFQMKVENATGDIWFTTLTGNTVGVVQKIENKTEFSYKITEFPLGSNTNPSGLFLKDGSVWIAELSTGKIIKLDILRNNVDAVVNVVKTLEIPQPDKVRFSSPTDVLVTNNETVWVTEHVPSTISEYDIPSNSWRQFSTAQAIHPIPTLPFWMRESLDHKGIWFNEHQGNRIGFLNTTDHTLTEFDIPNNQSPEPSPYMLNNPVSPQNIAAQNDYYSAVFTLNLSLDPKDPDKFWFSQWDANKIGVVDRVKPLAFDIHSDLTKVVFSGNRTMQTETIGVKISRSDDSISSTESQKMVFLKITSSMSTNGELNRMTANFTENLFDLSKMDKSVPVQLVLQNHGAKPGNYTLGISASDGLATKTIFLDLDIMR